MLPLRFESLLESIPDFGDDPVDATPLDDSWRDDIRKLVGRTLSEPFNWVGLTAYELIQAERMTPELVLERYREWFGGFRLVDMKEEFPNMSWLQRADSEIDLDLGLITGLYDAVEEEFARQINDEHYSAPG